MFDGTYNLDDLLDITEMMTVKAENERRFAEWNEQQRDLN